MFLFLRWRYIAAACNSEVCLFSRDGNLIWSYRGAAEVDGELHDVFIYSPSIFSDGEYIAALGVIKIKNRAIIYFFDKNSNLLWENKTVCANSLHISLNGEYIIATGKGICFFNKDRKLL